MKIYSSRSSFLSLVVLSCLLCHSASGAVVFNNFGPDDGYDGSRGSDLNWVVFSPGSSGNMGLGAAARFQVPSGNYALNSVTLAMGYILWTNNLAISIRADNGGLPTGSLLETVVTHPTNLTSDYLLVSYPSSLEPVMAGGLNYWLVVEPADLNLVNGDNNAAFSWYWSGTQGYGGYRDFNFAAAGWNNWQIRPDSLVPAFRIEGTVVPEPGAFQFWLAGLGLVGLHHWGRSQMRIPPVQSVH